MLRTLIGIGLAGWIGSAHADAHCTGSLPSRQPRFNGYKAAAKIARLLAAELRACPNCGEGSCQ